MNRSQLISAIVEHSGLTSTKAEKTLSAILDSIVYTLTQGGTVSLIGFGSFGVKKRSARKVRNPKTGAEMILKETLVPFFKAGKDLRNQIDTIKVIETI
jgi:DNA-binding protein HU-beta